MKKLSLLLLTGLLSSPSLFAQEEATDLNHPFPTTPGTHAISYDQDQDGKPDLVGTITIGEDGKPNGASLDVTGDGKPDIIGETTIEGEKTILKATVDLDGDGIINESIVEEKSPFGTSLTTTTFKEDGSFLSIEKQERDPSEKILQSSSDRNGDGVPDMTTVYQYNENGNLLSYETDQNGDGIPDSSKSFEYDEQGRPIATKQDNDGDGESEYSTELRYDEEGREIYSSTDVDGDGQPEQVDTKTYNTEGEVSEEQHLTYEDGKLASSFIEREDPKNGSSSSLIDDDGDGIFENVTRIRFDPNTSNLKEKTTQRDFDQDGRFDESVTTQYRDDGRKTSVSKDRDADGKADSIVFFVRDENGRLLKVQFDDNADGIIDREIETPDGEFEGEEDEYPEGFQETQPLEKPIPETTANPKEIPLKETETQESQPNPAPGNSTPPENTVSTATFTLRSAFDYFSIWKLLGMAALGSTLTTAAIAVLTKRREG